MKYLLYFFLLSVTVSALIFTTCGQQSTSANKAWVKDEIADSLINYVNKSLSIQNITAQKNFLGNAKFGSDTSLYVTEDATNEILDFQRKNASLGEAIRVTSSDADNSSFQISTIESASGADGNPNYTGHIGFNTNGAKSAEPIWETVYETNYYGSYPGHNNHKWMEYYLQYYDLNRVQRRPFGVIKSANTNWTQVGIQTNNFAINDTGNVTTLLDLYISGTDSAIGNLYPSWSPGLFSNSSYAILADKFKFYSIAERDSNWLYQQGYSLLKYGSYSGGSSTWLNPEPTVTMTRIGQNLMILSTPAETHKTYFYNTGVDTNETNTEMNFQSHYINFLDTTGTTAYSFNTASGNFDLGATTNLNSSAPRDTAWLYQSDVELIRYGIHGQGTGQGSTIWLNPNPALTQTRIGQNLLAWSQPSQTHRAGFYAIGADSNYLNTELFLDAHYVSFYDTSGQSSLEYNTETTTLRPISGTLTIDGILAADSITGSYFTFTGDLDLTTTGRVDLPSYDNMSFDSLVTRVAKMDTLNYGFSISDVADGSYSAAIFTTMPITVTMVRAVLRTTVDGTEDTAKCNIYFSTDISTGSPNKLWSTDKNVVDSTTGVSYTSFDDATIPAYSWIWMNCSAEEGTVNQLNMTVYARKD